MNKIKRIVLTGAPCGGKTVIFDTLRQSFFDYTYVPETAVLLLESSGFPAPTEYYPERSKEWQLDFEDLIFYLQKSIEDAKMSEYIITESKATILDRGLMDIAAHLPGKMEQFCKRYNVTEQEILNRYDVVIHLVSLAVLNPVKYMEVAERRWGNTYLSSLERAIELEESILEAWRNHPNLHIVDGNGDLEIKKSRVIEIINKSILA